MFSRSLYVGMTTTISGTKLSMRLDRGEERVEAGLCRGDHRLGSDRLEEPRTVLPLDHGGEEPGVRLRLRGCTRHPAARVRAREIDRRHPEPVDRPDRDRRGVAGGAAVGLGELPVPALE